MSSTSFSGASTSWIDIVGPLSFSALRICVCPTRAHSCRICRSGTLSACKVTRPFCIVNLRSPAMAGVDRPKAKAARNAQRVKMFFIVWLAIEYTPLRTADRARQPGTSAQLGDPERRVFAGQIAGAADVGAAALEVLAPGRAVGLRVPDFLD